MGFQRTLEIPIGAESLTKKNMDLAPYASGEKPEKTEQDRYGKKNCKSIIHMYTFDYLTGIPKCHIHFHGIPKPYMDWLSVNNKRILVFVLVWRNKG
jgi:hypothetical protein